MMTNRAFFEAGSAVVRVYAPLQGEPVPRTKSQEQAREGYAARKPNRAKRNANTSVALEAHAVSKCLKAAVLTSYSPGH
jgi:hypothetical protein